MRRLVAAIVGVFAVVTAHAEPCHPAYASVRAAHALTAAQCRVIESAALARIAEDGCADWTVDFPVWNAMFAREMISPGELQRGGRLDELRLAIRDRARAVLEATNNGTAGASYQQCTNARLLFGPDGRREVGLMKER